MLSCAAYRTIRGIAAHFIAGQTSLALCPIRREKVLAQHAASDTASVIWTGLVARWARGTFYAIAAHHSASSKRTAGAIHCTSSEIGLITGLAGFTSANVAVLACGTRVAGRPLGVRLPTWRARFTENPVLAARALAKVRTIRAVKTVLVRSIGLLSRGASFTSATFACPASRTRFAGRMIGHWPASIPARNALPAAGAVSGIVVRRHITVAAVCCCQPQVRFLPRRTSDTILAVWRVKPSFAVQAFSPCGVGLRPRITILAWCPIGTVALLPKRTTVFAD